MSFTQQELLDNFRYEDGKLFRTTGRNAGKECCVSTGNGYYRISLGNRTMLRHRAIFLMHHGYLPDLVDHVNTVKGDDRIENLREQTVSGNLRNIKYKKGMHVYPSGSKNWQVVFTINRKRIVKGTYDNYEVACSMAKMFRGQLYGRESIQ